MAITINNISKPVSQSGATNPFSFTITSSVGNMLIVAVSADTAVSAVSVTDNLAQTYTASGTFGSDASGRTWMSFCPNSATGVTSIKINHFGSGGCTIVAYDCSSTTGGQIDHTVAFSSQTTADPAINITPLTDGIVIGIVACNNNSPTPVSSPFTLDVLDVGALVEFGAAAHYIGSGGATLTATFTQGAVTVWNGLICAFREVPGAGWNIVNTGNATGGTTVAATTFLNWLTNPSLIVAVVSSNASIPASTTVTDTAGNTYLDSGLGSIFDTSGHDWKTYFFYALNTHTTSNNIVTVNVNDNGARIAVAEFTGNATSSPIDVTASLAEQSTGAGANTLVCPAVTPTVNGDLIVVGISDQQELPTAGTIPNAFISGAGSPGGNFFTLLEYRVQTTAALITPTAGSSAGNAWGAITVAFKPFGASSGTIFMLGHL